MSRDLQTHHRHSMRLKDYDYSSAGMYLVTMVTHNRECLFGDIRDGEMHLNQLGTIAHSEWLCSSEIRREIGLDVFVVMPNHLHGIVAIFESVGAHRRAPLQTWHIHVWVYDQPDNYVIQTNGMVPNVAGPCGRTPL